MLFQKGHKIYDEEDYLRLVLSEFGAMDLTAVFLPIFYEFFNLTMKYNQTYKIYREDYKAGVKFRTNGDPDYERTIYRSIKMYKQVKNMTTLIINPNFLFFELKYTTKANPSTVILYLFNAIAFWLDINVVDYPRILIRVFKENLRLFKNLYEIVKYKL